MDPLVCLIMCVCVCWSTDLEAKERTMEDMRLALTEQEETQSQMEEVLEEKLHLIQELSSGETHLTVRVRTGSGRGWTPPTCGPDEGRQSVSHLEVSRYE